MSEERVEAGRVADVQAALTRLRRASYDVSDDPRDGQAIDIRVVEQVFAELPR